MNFKARFVLGTISLCEEFLHATRFTLPLHPHSQWHLQLLLYSEHYSYHISRYTLCCLDNSLCDNWLVMLGAPGFLAPLVLQPQPLLAEWEGQLRVRGFLLYDYHFI